MTPLFQGGSTALIVACGVSGEKVGYKVATVLLDAGILIDTANKVGPECP
jgi:hypothetical protein